VWLALVIGLTAFFVPLPKDLLESEEILGAIVLIGTGLFLYLVFREERTHADKGSGETSVWKSLRFVKSFVDRLAVELKEIGLSRFFYTSFGVSFFILFFQILAFWLVMEAYDLNLSFWAGAVVFLIVHVGTAIPNAPANVGTYQFFCVVGLSLFGVQKTPATAFSVVVFVILTIPLWAIGFFALGRSGMTLTQIRSEINKLSYTAKTEKKEG
ncbi:MAG: lysylphosphatidylglycerol synthase transmembrane domain-containing protein, partial [Thermodesulfobacteriota bacterium]